MERSLLSISAEAASKGIWILQLGDFFDTAELIKAIFCWKIPKASPPLCGEGQNNFLLILSGSEVRQLILL